MISPTAEHQENVTNIEERSQSPSKRARTESTASAATIVVADDQSMITSDTASMTEEVSEPTLMHLCRYLL